MHTGRLRLFPYRIWFGVGVLISLALMATSCVLLTVLAYNTLAQRPANEQVLTPVVPGVNLPSNHLPYYLGALLLCGIFHEFGHAVAAAREDIRVQAAGIFVLGVYPGAFVDLNSADLALVSPARRLRVFCAGVWHNTVLALGAILLLIRPAWLLAPLGYSNASGAVVTWLAAGSVLSGQQGLYRAT
ncbi:hypothetical protein BOX15_Mlig015877g2 [Macrostomum lignano]|uniref:Membrane-bound transcription factor site-2 protease n=1 Tax=Macrostomum lignano TaxID=282301 RepID=A0A267DG07_9PLAT|nr:hypothetical protein BOX15_Mlig015877g2 [Macrostomum lignano]